MKVQLQHNGVNLAPNVQTKSLNENIYLFSIVGHRGSTRYTNNTIQAFQDSYDLGYRYIECDLRFTSDNHCVIYHDAAIGGTNVSSMTLAEVQAAASYVPTLEAVLLWGKRTKCAIELDCAGRLTSAQINSVYNVVKNYGMLHSVVFCAYESELQWLVDNNNIDAAVCISFYQSTPSSALIRAIGEDMKMFPYTSVSINNAYISGTEMIETAHSLGYGIKTWTITTKAKAQQMYEYGVDTILADTSTYWEME